MADDHVPSQQFSPDLPSTPVEAIRTGNSPSSDGAEPPPRQGEPWEIILLLRWVIGLILVVGCGWALIGVGAYLSYSYHLKESVLFNILLPLSSLLLFLYLEKDLWLSRFMGLRLGPRSSRLKEALFFWVTGLPGLLWRSTVTQWSPAVAAAEPAPAGKSRPEAQPHPTDSTREIVETIVFVVVLVLMLKSFAAEAFVIPTGSMAQTLWGYQKVVTCPKCHIEFPVNCSSEVDPTSGPPATVSGCTCPNCRQHIHFAIPGAMAPDFDSVEIPDPGWSSGDRVLVAKFVYDLFERAPDRLDVVVFKFPGNADFPASGPHKNHVPMNYIKRLIGLPGETIAIYRGKVYRLSPDKGLQYKQYDEARNNPELFAQLWMRKYTHANDGEARDRFHNGEFQIIRKKADTILATKRLVYDNDHPALDLLNSLPPRWDDLEAETENGWSTDNEHGFLHWPGDGEPHVLRYQHILRGTNGKTPQLITDFMGYNTWEPHNPPGPNWASDLILECEVTVEAPEGELWLELSKGVDRFQARWNLASGVCTLVRLTGEQEQKLDSKPTALSKKGTYRLRFANVDEKLTVWVDNSLPFSEDGVVYPPPADPGPRKENDLDRPASIGAQAAKVHVGHLKLFRDTYYTTGGPTVENADIQPSQSDVSFDPADAKTWETLGGRMPLLTMYVQPGHFLCMGDNSPESSDGRSWGLVPQRLLLGRALLVYYPFSRAGRIR